MLGTHSIHSSVQTQQASKSAASQAPGLLCDNQVAAIVQAVSIVTSQQLN